MASSVSITDYVIVLIAEELDVEPSTITPLSRFDEMAMDSLEFASIVLSLREKIGPIKTKAIQEAETVGDLIRALEAAAC